MQPMRRRMGRAAALHGMLVREQAMKMKFEFEFDFDRSIACAQEVIDRETTAHEKRMEFWKGYKCAMEEVQLHVGDGS
jgi:hypothetical protein